MIRKSTSRSDTFELRLSLGGERAQTLLRVLGGEQFLDSVAFAGERVGDRKLKALVGGQLDLADRRRGAVRQPRRVFECLLGDNVRRPQTVQHAEVVGLPR